MGRVGSAAVEGGRGMDEGTDTYERRRVLVGAVVVGQGGLVGAGVAAVVLGDGTLDGQSADSPLPSSKGQSDPRP